MCDTSRILESLSDTSGVQAFILAVDPNDLADGGFLGGSLIGREFWRQMRGGGDHGARAFKTHCASRLSNTSIIGVQVNHEKQDRISTPPPKAGPARSIKNELYDSVRNALRCEVIYFLSFPTHASVLSGRLASGIRGAEMKWTNPEKLDLYGVRLVGWPEGVPAQNPSTLKVNQNKLLLEAIQNGTLKFEKLNNVGATGGCQDPSRLGSNEVNEDFSWAYDADACPSSPPFSRTAASSLHKVVNQEPVSSNNIPRPGNETDTWSLDPNLEDNTTFSPYNVDYTWIGEFSEQMAGPSRGHSDSQLNAERPHKRQRSEEPYPVKEL